jgi:hypothetical protein
MMEAETHSETMDCNSVLTWVIAQEETLEWLERKMTMDKCEEDFAVLGDPDSVPEVGTANSFVLINSYKNNSNIPRLESGKQLVTPHMAVRVQNS